MEPTWKVLLVDDEIEICRSLRRLLRRSNLDVTFSTTPGDALALLKETHFDIVISDYRMPQMSGVEVLAEVARIAPDSLRLMLSACAEINTLASTFDERQVHRFIRKPWVDAEIGSNLIALLGEHRAARSCAEMHSGAEASVARSRVW